MKTTKAMLWLALGLAGVTATQASAQSWEFTAALGAGLRAYTEAPLPGGDNRRLFPSVTFEGRITGDLGASDRVVLSLFGRWENGGEGRSHTDLREAYWLHQGDGWSLTAGIDKVFWGVTESRHLVDIVNQDDLLEGIDGSAKLGQPMLGLSLYGDYGTFSFYALPGFRPRAWPRAGTRLGPPLPVGPAVYTGPGGKGHVDLAARWSNSIGDWDIGLSWFEGTSRAPVLVPAGGGLTPIYDHITQLGLDLQYTAGDWLWKLEAINRAGQGPRFNAVTAGFEWTLPGGLPTGADLGLLAEYSRDGRDPLLAPVTILDDDLFLGARLTLNDLASTNLLAGMVLDRRSGARLLSVKGARRIGESWQVSLEGRFFNTPAPGDPVAALANSDYLSLSLTRSF